MAGVLQPMVLACCASLNSPALIIWTNNDSTTTCTILMDNATCHGTCHEAALWADKRLVKFLSTKSERLQRSHVATPIRVLIARAGKLCRTCSQALTSSYRRRTRMGCARS